MATRSSPPFEDLLEDQFGLAQRIAEQRAKNKADAGAPAQPPVAALV